jgi:hypothetical protein
MSLFGTILKQGAKFADNLFDDVAIQAKHVDEVWDEAAWLEANPRPHPDVRVKDMSPEQRKEYNNWISKKDYAKNKDKRNAAVRARREADPEAARDSNRRSYIKHRDARIRRQREYNEANREEINRKARDFARDNPEVIKQRARKHYEANRAKIIERARIREADLADRTVPWRNQEEIEEIYRQAAILSEASGVPMEVDHIIPLRGENVSGLHHEDNLLIMPRRNNRAKSNLFDLDTVLPPPRKRR